LIGREDRSVEAVAQSQTESIAERESAGGIPEPGCSLGIGQRDLFYLQRVAQDEGAGDVPVTAVLDDLLRDLRPVGTSDPSTRHQVALDYVSSRFIGEKREEGRSVEDRQANASCSDS
jgi:hypothetical protein